LVCGWFIRRADRIAGERDYGRTGLGRSCERGERGRDVTGGESRYRPELGRAGGDTDDRRQRRRRFGDEQVRGRFFIQVERRRFLVVRNDWAFLASDGVTVTARATTAASATTVAARGDEILLFNN
jgi:hypothetical protein